MAHQIQGRPRALLIGLGLAALIAAWSGGTPPGSAPDETAHYLRAVSVGRGQWLGRPPDPCPGLCRSGADRLAQATARTVDVPAGLVPPDFSGCFAHRPQVSAACSRTLTAPPTGAAVRSTQVGSYPPTPYLVPGILMRVAANPFQAAALGRIGTGVVGLLLLLLAAAALTAGRRGGLPLYGLLLATTPMVVFLDGSLNPSGIEISGAICYFAGIWRAIWSPIRVPPQVWAAVGVGGLMLGSVRPLGPVWVALGFALWPAALGPAAVWRRARGADRSGVAGTGLAILGAVLGLAWALWAEHSTPITTSPRLFSAAVRDLPNILVQQIGVFGWLDTALPHLFYLIWAAALATLVAAAWRVGDRRQRSLLAGSATISLLASILVPALLVLSSGSFGQGRYTMATTVAVPLLAGEILATAGIGTRLNRALPWAAAAIGAGQLFAWVWDARRYAYGTGHGSLSGAIAPLWAPDLGWLPWLALAVLGSALVALSVAGYPGSGHQLVSPRISGTRGRWSRGPRRP